MSKYIDFVDTFVMGVLKHLIHIFVALFCISFLYIIVILMREEEDSGSSYDSYEAENSAASYQIGNLILYHPVYYGFKELASKVGVNATSALERLSMFNKRYTDIRKDGRSVVIHPLYVELMMASRWNVLRSDKFDIDADHTYDPVTKPLAAKGFYQAYVSKSLPCVFRNEIKNDEAVKELRA